ncbi:MAG: hypothetical protein FRX49_05926 [Trebouxia sp. A1-2]|nr:MAG: hypothetical protein FRX49_05926 [Trebouxia sp. A1-2]
MAVNRFADSSNAALNWGKLDIGHLAALKLSHGYQPLPNAAITCITWVIWRKGRHGYGKAFHEGHVDQVIYKWKTSSVLEPASRSKPASAKLEQF